MTKIIPSFTFSGQCANAIELYQKAFGAEVVIKLLYSEANPKDYQYKTEAEKDLIFHCQLKIGEQIIIVSDDSGGMLKDDVDAKTGKTSLQNLLVSFSSDDELKAAYEALLDGGEVFVPLCSPSYASLYVFLVDKFGGRWELMSGYDKW